jgi:hypothetical protein
MSKYMLIDVTSVSTTSVLKIAPLQEIQLWGKIYQAENKKVIAPPVLGRGFAKLNLLQLHYLYYHLTNGGVPPADYAELTAACFAIVGAMPLDETPIKSLQTKVDKLYPDGGLTAKSQEEAKEKKQKVKDPLERPKATSTTGLVWEICDGLFAKANTMPSRKDVLEACTAEEINPATASTQFSKWKASRIISLGS